MPPRKRQKLTPAKESIIRHLEYLDPDHRMHWLPPPRWKDDKDLAMAAIQRCNI